MRPRIVLVVTILAIVLSNSLFLMPVPVLAQELEQEQDAPEAITADQLTDVQDLESLRYTMRIDWVTGTDEEAEIAVRGQSTTTTTEDDREEFVLASVRTSVGESQRSYQFVRIGDMVLASDNGEWITPAESPVEFALREELGSSVDIWLAMLVQDDILLPDWHLNLDELLADEQGVFVGTEEIDGRDTWHYRFSTVPLPEVEGLGQVIDEEDQLDDDDPFERDGDQTEDQLDDDVDELFELDGDTGNNQPDEREDDDVDIGEEETLGQEPSEEDQAIADVWVVPEFALPVRVQVSDIGGDVDDDIGPLTMVWTISRINEPIIVNLPE